MNAKAWRVCIILKGFFCEMHRYTRSCCQFRFAKVLCTTSKRSTWLWQNTFSKQINKKKSSRCSQPWLNKKSLEQLAKSIYRIIIYLDFSIYKNWFTNHSHILNKKIIFEKELDFHLIYQCRSLITEQMTYEHRASNWIGKIWFFSVSLCSERVTKLPELRAQTPNIIQIWCLLNVYNAFSTFLLK